MSRDIPFDEEATCDECGKQGAFDFMGDYLCAECAVYVGPGQKRIEMEEAEHDES